MKRAFAGERILVVDDEAPIRRLLSRFLTSRGADVTLAQNTAAAIRHLHEQRIDKLVTDVDMPPGPSGLWLLQEINRRWPAVQVVITTGSPLLSTEISGAEAVLLKPYSLSDLISCLVAA